jgi:formamidopyrimidine-DNA glycosylase
MPEGPEVETVRRDLEKLVVGSTITAVRATGRRSVRRYGDGPSALAAFESDVTGLRIVGTGRLGKYVWLQVDRGPESGPPGQESPAQESPAQESPAQESPVISALVIHLRMSGQVRWHVPSDELALHTHIVMVLDNGHELRFVDPRTFGEVWRTDDPIRELAHIGPDAVIAATDARTFSAALRARRSPTKAVLLDQGFVAGIGNIYSDEICFAAGVRPTKRANELTKPQAARIATHTQAVLTNAIERRGSSLKDRQYVDLLGEGGLASAAHHVYDRLGQPCLICGTSIERTKIAGRSSYFCRKCQR